MLNEMSSHVKLRINAHFLESKRLEPKLMNLVEIYLFCLSSCRKKLRNLWKAYLRWWNLIHEMHIHWKAVIQRFYHFQKYQDVNSVLDKNPDSSLVALEKPPLSNLKPILEKWMWNFLADLMQRTISHQYVKRIQRFSTYTTIIKTKIRFLYMKYAEINLEVKFGGYDA